MKELSPLTWAEIDLKAIAHNIKEIRRLAGRNQFILPSRSRKPIDILTVIKADAYGHGVAAVGKFLNQLGISHFAVSDVKEGIELRTLGITKPIVLLEATLPAYIKSIVDYQLTPTVCSQEFAVALNRYATKRKRPIPIHLNIDTGMGRLGIWHEEAFSFVKAIFQLRYLNVAGIYTHFPVADTDRAFTLSQIDKLYKLVMRLDRAGMVIPYIHAVNSMGLAGFKTRVLNLVRPGLMIYGLYPDLKFKKSLYLKTAMSVKSKIIFIKTIDKGRSVSYGRTFVAKRKMRVATIPIGYSDGFLRGLSHKSAVLIRGIKCPILGRVTMDQIVVDISRVKSPQLGMTVTVLGKEGKQSISAEDLAVIAHTINYEIVCSLGNCLPRIYI